MSISDARLAQIGARFAEMEARLASGTLEGGEFVAASRDYAELEPVARAAAAVRAMRAEQDDLAAMQDDPEMRALAEEELARLREELPRPNARSPSPCCRAIPPTAARRCWKSARARVGMKRPSSPPTSTACMNASLPNRGGGSR
jgi:hypothetical protein